ncbi:uncharacterized protein LOC105202730 isoform X3 [Solenopsis invicta]|nr:uncharacterized protein LOC105202730 isoform X3 [Solenopsis invicta]
MLSSAKRHDVEDSGLNLDAPSVVKVRRMKKSRSRTGRSEINSVYRKSNAISKGRKRKAKLQSSISKSTVTTKDTGFISREEVKKRRRKGSSVHQQSNLPKHLRKFNDVVEIFHNTKLKKSNSRVSNKCSKDVAKYEKKLHLPETKEAPKKIQETLMLSPKSKCLEHVNRKVHDKENEKEHCISHDKQNEQDNGSHGKSIEKNHCGSHDKKNQQQLQTLNNKNNSEATPEVAQEQNKSEKNSKDLSPSTKNETRQCERAFSRYDDPTFMASYEMPTLASKLKRSCRSYYSRYNFRNIPFVVGTSVTPSHNLGLNIQQVLSVMKMRQSIASDITPSLIRKVSRGIKPMSIFLDQMNGHYEGSVLDVSSQMSGTFNCVENIGKNKRLSAFNLQPVNKTQSGCVTKASVDAENISEKQINVSKQSCKGKSDSCDNRTKQQASSTVSKSNIQASPKHQQGISLKGNIGDHKIHIPDLHNSNEIRDVLIKLHDQLEQMNTKYERLQSQVDKSSDKSLTNELSAMEKELNAKEEEINAVVGLYKEVSYYWTFVHSRWICPHIVINDIAETGNDAEAANENAARKKQSGLHSNRVYQGHPQESFFLLDDTRKVPLYGSGADFKSKKVVECRARTARFHAAGRVITADSNFSQAIAACVVTSHWVTVKELKENRIKLFFFFSNRLYIDKREF